MRQLEATVLGSLLMVILLVAHSQSAPYRDDFDLFDRRELPEEETLESWILRDVEDFKRDSRTHLDAGLLSRGKILTKLAEIQEAHDQANDPHGPGRRRK